MNSALTLESLSIAQLDELMKRAAMRRSAMARDLIPSLRKQIARLIRDNGLAIADVLGGEAETLLKDLGTGKSRGGKGKSRSKAATGTKSGRPHGYKVAPKYRDLENPALTWAGRGKPPKWLAAHLDAGRTLEEFRIVASPSGTEASASH